MSDYSKWEIARKVSELEAMGFVVTRPSEKDIECSVEIERQRPGDSYSVPLRLALKWNGETYYTVERFPFELLCDPQDAEFRERAAPHALANQMGRYIADKLMPGIQAQLKEKIKPLIPREPISLGHIEMFLAMSLDDRFTEEDIKEKLPMFYNGPDAIPTDIT